MNNHKAVNIGVIGVGAFMARQHLPNILKNPGIQLHTFCDLDKNLLEMRKKEYNPLSTTLRAEEVFENKEIDAVLIGTQGRSHAHFVEMSANFGKDVYVEKPMTMTYEETNRILEIVSRNPIQVGIGFNRRFAPSVIAMKEKLQSYKTGPANIVYRIVDDHRVRPHYIFDMNEGGGHLLQEACHIFDLLTFMLEAEPVEIYAAGPLETDNIVIMTFDDGSVASIICGGKGGLFYPKELMEIFCDNRTLVLDHFYELRYDGSEGSEIKRFGLASKNEINLEEPSMTELYNKIFASRPKKEILGPHAANGILVPQVEKGHSQAMVAFAEAVVNRSEYSINVHDGARATVCALKAYDSIRSNKPISISKEDYGL